MSKLKPGARIILAVVAAGVLVWAFKIITGGESTPASISAPAPTPSADQYKNFKIP